MDAFKRTYSNQDTEKVAIPYFWEHFNKEDYSIWLAEYMYNDELALIFMACNLVGGMFQRLEKLRKTAFASIGIFGKDHEASISGIWIFRTQDLAFSVSPSHEFVCLIVCTSAMSGDCVLLNCVSDKMLVRIRLVVNGLIITITISSNVIGA